MTETTETTDTLQIQTGHVGLNVGDLDRSLRFYREVFDFEIIAESRQAGRRFAFLGNGGGPVLTLWEQSTGPFPPDRPGLHHLSFQVETIGQVHALEHRLQERGVRFLYDGVVPHAEGTDSGGIYFEDPDGIRLEVFSPTGAGDRLAPVADAPSCGFF